MPRLELFPFRYRDELTGKWKRARYVAERHEIAERHAEFEIVGPPEIREVDPDARMHNPELQRSRVTPRPKKDPPEEEEPPIKDPPPQEPPVDDPPGEDPGTLDGLQRFLLLVFLRRYVTYCARRRRFAAMNGAARLFPELKAPATGPLA